MWREIGQRLTSWRTALIDNRFVIGDQALVLILAVVPFLALSVISLVKPIFNARGLLPLAPYLLLVLSAGIVRVARHPIPAVALLAVLGIAHYLGLKAYTHVSAGRADYKAFAAALVASNRKPQTWFFFILSFIRHHSFIT